MGGLEAAREGEAFAEGPFLRVICRLDGGVDGLCVVGVVLIAEVEPGVVALLGGGRPGKVCPETQIQGPGVGGFDEGPQAQVFFVLALCLYAIPLCGFGLIVHLQFGAPLEFGTFVSKAHISFPKPVDNVGILAFQQFSPEAFHPAESAGAVHVSVPLLGTGRPGRNQQQRKHADMPNLVHRMQR